MSPLSSSYHLTRRALLGRSATLAAGGVAVCLSPTLAQTPTASPVAEESGAELLVDANWLRDHLGDPDLLPIALMPADDFETAHIPGSFSIDWPELELVDTSEAGVTAWEESIRGRIGDLKIVPEARVVVYDNGTLFAARLWWVLRYLGHEDVRVLDGGLPAWQATGGQTESGPVVMTMEKRPPYAGVSNVDLLATHAEVLAAIGSPDVAFVDARTSDEYASGHIPGAVNVNYPENATGTPPMWRSVDDLRQLYGAAEVMPAMTVIPYCSSGVRSAVTAFSLAVIGYERVSLYSGSWNEWSELPDAPITTGDAP